MIRKAFNSEAMTFRDISYKMLKANIKQYRLFILCNVASIAILFSFLSVYNNKRFMNESIVNSMISSNIIMPTLLLLIFIGVFIPYTQNAFMKARQKDYGILLTLGMTESEVRNSVLKENGILCLIFLLGGLIFGTALSAFFLGFIRYALGIDGIGITFSLPAYAETAVYAMMIFMISLAANIIGLARSSIREKLRLTEKTENKGGSLPLLVIGTAITAVSLICLFFFYRASQNVFIICWLLCVIGSALIFFNGSALLSLIRNKRYKKYIRNILVLSDIKYYYGKNKKIFFVNAWLFFIIFFFTAFAMVSYPNMTRYAAIYHPFDMAYAEIKGSFEPLSDAEVNTIAHNNGDEITLNDGVEFVRNNAFTVFCVDDVNRLLDKNYSVAHGSFLFVYGFDPNDGYEHDYNFDISSLGIKSGSGQMKFTIQGKIADPLFGQINAVSNYMLLADKTDFARLAASGGDFYIKGTLHLFSFENWRNSAGTVDSVWKQLALKNNLNVKDYESSRFYQVSSRTEAYNTAIKSCNLLIFVFLYLSLLLYFAAVVMIHFKLRMEYDNEKKKFRSLYRIGIQETEVKTAVYQKILVIFLVSPVYSIILNFAFGVSIFSQYRFGTFGILCVAVMSFIFLFAHWRVCRRYAGVYGAGVIEEMPEA